MYTALSHAITHTYMLLLPYIHFLYSPTLPNSLLYFSQSSPSSSLTLLYLHIHLFSTLPLLLSHNQTLDNYELQL